ncbi:MAG: hypothetical protein ABFQ89_02555 [Chloroflexota bacterium]
MPDLRSSLIEHDIALLRAIGESWGLDLGGLSRQGAIDQLYRAMLDADVRAETGALPDSAREAYDHLVSIGGSAKAGPFFRQYGEIRPFGPGRLEREMPWHDPVNQAEVLWYHGLIYLYYERTDLGDVQMVYVPQELQRRMPSRLTPALLPKLEPSSSTVRSCEPFTEPQLPEAGLVEDCCTLLAFVQRNGDRIQNEDDVPFADLVPYVQAPMEDRLCMLWTVSFEMGLMEKVDDATRLDSDVASAWMRTSYPEQASAIAKAWVESEVWNDLRRMPGVVIEDTGWTNDPLLPRRLVLDLLAELDRNVWYELDSLAHSVKEVNPDFQRTTGEYEKWHIRSIDDNRLLTGFENWDQVEGELLLYLIKGPMRWLGLIELGENLAGKVIAFRPTVAGQTFTRVESYPYPPGPAAARIQVHANGLIHVPLGTDRLTRFQVARLTDWVPLKKNYSYWITPGSLSRAQESGTPIGRALSFLASRSGKPVPESLQRAIQTWQSDGTLVNLRKVRILQVQHAHIMQRLRSSPELKGILGEPIGPTASLVNVSDWTVIYGRLAELGYLADVDWVDHTLSVDE